MREAIRDGKFAAKPAPGPMTFDQFGDTYIKRCVELKIRASAHAAQSNTGCERYGLGLENGNSPRSTSLTLKTWCEI
jgi:hypothetical protein